MCVATVILITLSYLAIVLVKPWMKKSSKNPRNNLDLMIWEGKQFKYTIDLRI